MPEKEKINYSDLITLFEDTKANIQEAGLRCDTIHMNPEVYDIIVAGLRGLSGLKIMKVTCMGLKLVKSKLMPENVVIFSHQGKVKRIEDWDLKGLKNT